MRDNGDKEKIRTSHREMGAKPYSASRRVSSEKYSKYSKYMYSASKTINSSQGNIRCCVPSALRLYNVPHTDY